MFFFTWYYFFISTLAAFLKTNCRLLYDLLKIKIIFISVFPWTERRIISFEEVAHGLLVLGLDEAANVLDGEGASLGANPPLDLG